jgi:hypothetical protein
VGSGEGPASPAIVEYHLIKTEYRGVAMNRRTLHTARTFLLGLFVLVVSGCTVLPWAKETAQPSGDASQAVGRLLIVERGEYFSASAGCASCHTNLKDTQGNDISIDTHWRGTMMANSARDPYFQASLRSETLQHPQYRAAIEKKCSTCHTPMAHTTAVFNQQTVSMLNQGFYDSRHSLHRLAMDGISCSQCHQIQNIGFGDPKHFSGGYVIDPETPHGEREAFGPYETEQSMVSLMQGASGFIPEEANHLGSAAYCGICHTLYTETITVDGHLTGRQFPEQTPYLEWKHSRYAAEDQPCQSCHMPTLEDEVRISNVGGPPRAPFSRHHFVGGNVFMLNLIRANGDELQVTAEDEHLLATAARTQEHLQQRAAQITVHASIEEDHAPLVIDVNVRPLTGHKFPTGFPSRRAWLHLTVRDSSGNVLFESGAWTEDGRITGNANDEDASLFEPHYLEITRPDQVQIYEAIMADSAGKITTGLLYANAYVKENRLLPQGFNKTTAPADIAVTGRAYVSPAFTGGGDQVRYIVDTNGDSGPYNIEVKLLYQSISYPWIEKFKPDESAEAAAFLRYASSQPNVPVVIARAETLIR